MDEHGSLWIQSTQPSVGTAMNALWFNTSTGVFSYLQSQNPDVWATTTASIIKATNVPPTSTSLALPALLTAAASATDLSSVISTLNNVIAALKAAGLMATS